VLRVIRESWALLFGLTLLMLGNGMQATLLGVRGAIEGISPGAMSWVMSSYFAGLLIGARLAPRLIRRVGHVRVFAALASMISAGFIVYAWAPDPWVWGATRFVVGFCFCGVYVVCESWLNDRATNETRGQAMSAYMLVQSFAVIAAQGLVNLADPGGWDLFALMSALVSVAVAPMLLSTAPAPAFGSSQPMPLRRLFAVSPLGCVATFMLGGVFSAMFGMAAVYGGLAGLGVGEISALVAALYAGGLAFQIPVGRMSDRMDRRRLIVGVCALGAVAALAGAVASGWALLAAAALIGGAASPLYGLIIAYTNDFLEPVDMAAGSGGLLFLNGVGAVTGPVTVGWLMERFGPSAFFLYIAGLLGFVGLYGLWRMVRRPATPAPRPFAPLSPGAQAVAVAAAQASGRGEADGGDGLARA
jgi:MFS family permease